MFTLFSRFALAMDRPIMLVRVASLLAVAGILAQYVFLQAHYPDFEDPPVLRGSVIFISVGLFIASFSAHEKRVRMLTPHLLVIMGLWIQWLAYLNDFHEMLVPFLCFFLIVIGYAYEQLLPFNLHFLFFPSLTLLNLWIADLPEAIQWRYTVAFLVISGMSYLILLHLKRQKIQLQQLNEQLQFSQDMLVGAQLMARIGSWHIDLNTNKVHVSPEFFSLFEMRKDRPLTKERIFRHYEGEPLRQLKQAIRQCLETGQPFDLKMPIITEKCNRKFVRIIAHPLIKNGQASWLYGIMQDITPEMEASEQLRRAKEAAEAATLAKSQFLSSMSHEIRTPMSGVIGMTDLLLEDNPRADQVDYLQTLHFSAKTLLGLINNILDFSKIEAGKLTLEYVAFDLPALLENLQRAFVPLAREKGIGLYLEELGPLPCWVKGDPTRLAQVLNNLISNAIKFTAKGSVRLTAQGKTTEQGWMLTLKVSDTGIGIAPDKLETIFLDYHQAEDSTARQYGGTGLGLTIARQLLTLMGGTIDLDSHVGKGTTFTCELPLQLTEVSENVPQAAESLKSEAATRVLLVEDNPINVLLTQRFLEHLVAKVEVAENGRIGVEKARQQAFDLILMDLQMPEMDGFAATQAIRSFDPEVPILALTAEANLEVVRNALSAGMNDYLVKPFKALELQQKIAELLSVSSQLPSQLGPNKSLH